MELRHLRYFVMAAEELNISRASARLNVSQPAVSRQIKDLEAALGVELFHRGPNGLSLSEAGNLALAHAREVLRQASSMVEAVEAMARKGPASSLKVGFIPTALPGFLAEGMRQFNRDKKGVCVQIFELSPTEQAEALKNGEIDLALIGEASLEVRRDFHVETIRKTEMAIVVPDDHRLAHRKSLELAELGNDIFLTLHEKHFPGRPSLMADLFAKAGIRPEVALRANGLSELLGLIGGGAGVAVAPADLAQLPHAGVTFIKMKKPKLTIQFCVAWPKTSDQLKAIEKLVELIRRD